MAELCFRYGAMNSGKSTALIQAAYNYEERGRCVLIAKSAIDTKGGNTVFSRLGASRKVDLLFKPQTAVREMFSDAAKILGRVDCLLIDEAQFLAADQIDDLLRIAVLDDVRVLAYGLRTDFRTNAFPGSARLLSIAHSVKELSTICRCGSNALFNARLVDGLVVFDGYQVAIEESENMYEAMCAGCYFAISDGRLR